LTSAVVKNIRHWLRLRWNLLNVISRHDVLVERAVTFKFWRSIRFGAHCTVQSAAYIYGSRAGTPVVFGDHVVVSSGCMVLGEGGISIGDYSHLGPQVVLTTQYGDPEGEMCTPDPVRKYAAIALGKGCWIGACAVVMPGTVLGDRCKVAPNSVVFGTWGDNVTLAGNPARPRQ
jgi:acetyltransferase-like isoleucine patch superfamily enzyme